MTVTMKPFRYADGNTPDGYACGKCGKDGVKLYRQYQTFMSHQELFCLLCAIEDQGEQTEWSGKVVEDGHEPHSIGWLVAAVPTEEADTFWGYSSVPQDGVEWWKQLPATT